MERGRRALLKGFQPAGIFKERRLLLVGGLILLLAALFLLGSRMPALSDKALMGEQTGLAGLGFDVLVPVDETSPLWQRIFYTGINWMYTNKQGMTFGILMGAALLTLFPLLQKTGFNNRFLDAVSGVFIGAPMGVCVNCATPIAQGIRAGGGRLETMLSAMFSSPTLNIIVLSMVFSLFPLYMGLVKVGFTLLFILVGVPLLTRFVPGLKELAISPEQTAALDKAGTPGILLPAEPIAQGGQSWTGAARWVGRAFGRNLWFIARTTVPLMILAGFLGAAVVTVLPLESLADLIPQTGRLGQLLMMGGLAVVGLFLPVPMAFDVIITAVLLQAGLPVKYAMVLLLTLGVFSVYPFALIWRTISRPLALSLAVVLAGIGLVGGAGGHYLYKQELARLKTLAAEMLQEIDSGPTQASIVRSEQGEPADKLLGRMEVNNSDLLTVSAAYGTDLQIQGTAYLPAASSDLLKFERIYGPAAGLAEHDNFSVMKLMEPWAFFRGVAAGDVHNDGWVDLVFTSDIGLGLYANLGGGSFGQQNIDIPLLNDVFVANSALIDLDNDGWLDLFFSTFRKGNFVIYNDKGEFRAENLVSLPNQPEAMVTGAAAFGDVDRDGDLDIVLGNWAPPPHTEVDTPAMRDVWLENRGREFALHLLSGFPGEAFSALLTDFNGDGSLDLLVGNDRLPPDDYYLGDGHGNFQSLNVDDGLIPYTTNTTMSVTTTDLNNDLRLEIYAAEISPEEDDFKKMSSRSLCGEVVDSEGGQKCAEIMTAVDQIRSGSIQLDRCLSIDEPQSKRDCVVGAFVRSGINSGDPKICKSLPDSWADVAFICRYQARNRRISAHEKMKSIYQAQGALPKKNESQANVLLMWDGDRMVDRAAEYGIDIGGWSWNARFADLNNDEWQDLMIANGYLVNGRQTPNYVYLNQEGQGFIEAAEVSGLTSYFDTSSYTYADFDRDGDLDIVVVPAVGPVWLYINHMAEGNAISFAIQDEIGNHFGLGSKVIIHYGPAGERHQMRELQAGGGFLSYDPSVAHFGLGAYDRVDRVEIFWSTGEHSVIEGELPAGSQYVITRPAGQTAEANGN